MNKDRAATLLQKELEKLKSGFAGEIRYDDIIRHVYATDASAYRELPLAVAFPKSEEDILKLLKFARSKKITLIPRGAGTSLAGQVVGNGIITDVSKYMNQILEINKDEKWVRVQPGLVLDELNIALKKHGLFFAPETSTSNRCVIGGMIGNNSSGLHSIVYGTTREHIIELKCMLGDGSVAVFRALDKKEFDEKCVLENLEGNVYRQARELLTDTSRLAKIDKEFPDREIVRRNTGYALDELSECNIFRQNSNQLFNFARLLAGSEGTLAFTLEAKLNLEPLPPPQKGLICVHLNSVMEAIRANLVALKYKPGAVELMDNKILQLTLENIEQRKNRFFVQGNPGAILMIEFSGETINDISVVAENLVNELKSKGLGYHFPLVTGNDIKKVWDLRKAGLGVLSNIPGDAKPVSVIEDTSVNPSLLENYITDFNKILDKYKLECVYHAHISVGELHLRPILNLKDPSDIELYRILARSTAELVKKYRGSLSGEHGDGRLRGEFIPVMVGTEIYSWFREIKNTWDPDGVLNALKIVDTPPMHTSLRYSPGAPEKEIETFFDFSKDGGYLRSVEKCNGSADCRKTELIGGTMCPSYMATRNETMTTRARANILREIVTASKKSNPFDHHEIYEVLDLCLSCKACKAECPSNIDMAKLKAEFLQHYYETNHIPLRTLLIAYMPEIYGVASIVPGIFNYFTRQKLVSGIIKQISGFAQGRHIPSLSNQTFLSWAKKELSRQNSRLINPVGTLYLFADEFSNYNEADIAIKTARLLNRLNYQVLVKSSQVSGRTFISKGLLRKARKIAENNVNRYRNLINDETPLIGIEPSAILCFRDEYPELLRGELQQSASLLANHVFTIDEFITREFESGRISRNAFKDSSARIFVHGHCQQKAIASIESVIKMLSIPQNFRVEEIKSGCCGMAGSFGYEKEHYELSKRVGELVLFPAVRKKENSDIVAASGTSCRHQIKDGTGTRAMHPVEILYEALN